VFQFRSNTEPEPPLAPPDTYILDILQLIDTQYNHTYHFAMKVISEREDLALWFQNRYWGLSANQYHDNKTTRADIQTHASKIYFPESTNDVSELLQSVLDPTCTSPVACVCGGHESSNVALLAEAQDSTILDMALLADIVVDKENMRVTVGAGVRMQALAEAVRDAHGALPIGTGATVGVLGYVLNGGISGYFSRRLGLLGQRVVRLTFVTADGELKELSAPSTSIGTTTTTTTTSQEDSDLFFSILGAGSALGIVTSMTFAMEDEAVVQGGGQIIVPCGSEKSLAQAYARDALIFMKENILDVNEEGAAMELIVTADNTVIANFVFYDSFPSFDRERFVDPFRKIAANHHLKIVFDNVAEWKSWYEVASSLWPIVSAMQGNPILTLQHACGTKGPPSTKILDFIANQWIGESPIELAPMSIIECRTLGGAIERGRLIPTGNLSHPFFVNLLLMYDADGVSSDDRKTIKERTRSLTKAASDVDSLTVDFSGTSSQPDDFDHVACGADIFGTEAAYHTIVTTKKKIDSHNRFRFHPFAFVLN
jgi:hypothetical protein